jgi:hypothetical protein
MDSFWNFLLDAICRLVIIGLPVLGYAIEKNNDTSLIFGITCFISSVLIGVYGRNYDKIKY